MCTMWFVFANLYVSMDTWICGESWYHKRYLTCHPSSQGWASIVSCSFCLCVCLLSFLSFFLSLLTIVCFKHVIIVCTYIKMYLHTSYTGIQCTSWRHIFILYMLYRFLVPSRWPLSKSQWSHLEYTSHSIITLPIFLKLCYWWSGKLLQKQHAWLVL